MSKSLPPPVFTLKCENYIPNCLKFHADDRILYAGTQSGEILVWNLETYRLKNVTKAGVTCITTLLIKNNQLLSHNKIGEIQFWQINRFELVLRHTLATNVIGFCKLAPYKTNMLLCKGEKSSMNCYSADTYDKLSTFDPKRDGNLGDLMDIKSVSDYVFCGYEANVVVVWKDDNVMSRYSFPELDCLMSLDVDRTAVKGVCAGSSNVLNTFCISADGQLSSHKKVEITNPGVSVVRLRSDDKIVAVACWDFTVRLFSWKSMKLLALVDSHSTGVLNITYSGLSSFWKFKYMLAVANKDNKITLWDIYNKNDT